MVVDGRRHLTGGVGPIVYRMQSGVRGRLGAVLATALVVAGASAAALALVAGAARTVSAPARYSTWRGATFDASLEQAAGRPRTEEVRALPAVSAVETATFVFGGVIPAGGAEPVESLVFAGTSASLGVRLADGREPDPASVGEFLATPSFLETSGASLGDEFQVITITQEQADQGGFDAEPAGPTWTGTLVGVVDGPALLQDPTPLALFPPAALAAGDIGVASTVGLVSLTPGSSVEDLRTQLDALPEGDEFGLDSAEWISEEVRSAVSTQGQGLAVIALIVAVATVAVLGQLLTRQARLSGPQRLAMSALGLTRLQSVCDGVGRAALPVAAGALVGAGVAFAASGMFPFGFVRAVEPHPGLLFDPLVHGLGTVLLAGALLAWVLAALALGRRTTSTPREVGVVDRVAPRIRSVAVSTGVRFAFSGARRDPRSASLAGLVVVLVVLVGALTFGSNLVRLLDEPHRYGGNFDLSVGQGGDEVPEEVRAVLDADPDVAALTLYGTTFASVGTASLDVTGMQRVRGDLVPDIVEGRLPDTDREIVLGGVAARELNLEIGDDLTVEGGAGPAVFRVTGRAVIPAVEGGDGIGEGGVVTLEGLRRIEPSARLGTAAIELRPGAPAGVAERLSAETGVTIGGRPDRPSTIVNLDRVRSIPALVAAALGALVVLSMAHQLVTSARARRRDIAILRALGLDRRRVTGVVHWQASAVVLALLVVAAPLGVALGNVAYRAFVERIGAADDVTMPFGLLALTFLSLLVAGNAVAAGPARRARHRLPARVLAQE